MKKSFLLLFALAVVAALAVSGCYRTPEERAEHIVKHISSELNLNDAQKAKLEKIKDEFLARRADMMKDRHETYDEAIAFMKGDQIDQAKLNALLEKSQARTSDAVKFFVSKFVEFHDMLTPEQRAKAAEKMVEMKEKYKEHHKE